MGDGSADTAAGGARQGRRRLASMLCAAAFLGTACAGAAGVAQPAADAKVGQCHLIATPEAMVAASDGSPTVPCTGPHTAEVLLTFSYDGRYRNRRSRPQPEQLDADVGDKCANYDVVRSYLGAAPVDAHWGVDVVRKYPSRAEWGRGVRMIRCDLVAETNGSDSPRLTSSLRGVLQRPGSARFRECARRSKALTCDVPHDREVLSGTPVLRPGPYPGKADLQAQAIAACMPLVDEYAGGIPSGMTVKPMTPSADAWGKGDRGVGCAIGPGEPGQLVTGTVRRGAS